MLTAQVANGRDLKNLSEVSKCICEVALPRLYESITLSAADYKELRDLRHSVERLPLKKLGFTRDIWVKSPLHTNLRRRCLHHRSGMVGTTEEDSGDDDDGGSGDDSSEVRGKCGGRFVVVRQTS